MSIIKQDEQNQIIPLTPAAKSAIVVAASSGALWITQRVIRRVGRHLIQRAAPNVEREIVPSSSKRLTVRIGRRIYRRFPDGSIIEGGEEYVVQFDGDTPDDLSISLGASR